MRDSPAKAAAYVVAFGRRVLFFFSSRRRHTRFDCDWSSDVCSSDLRQTLAIDPERPLTLTALALERVVARSYAEARRWLDSALTVDPTFAIGYAHREIGRASCRERV